MRKFYFSRNKKQSEEKVNDIEDSNKRKTISIKAEKANFILALFSTSICIITFCMVIYHMKHSGFHMGLFIDKYWDRIILLSGIIGFFIREIYKLYLKKEEINFSLYQKNKINSIYEYIDAYNDFKQSICDLPFNVFSGKINGSELDSITTYLLDKMKKKDLMLRIFLDDQLYIKFKQITDESILLVSHLSTILKHKELTNDKYQEAINKNITYFKYKEKYQNKVDAFLSEAIKTVQDKMT